MIDFTIKISAIGKNFQISKEFENANFKYTYERLFVNSNSLVYKISNTNYPFFSFSYNNYRVFVEGAIYNLMDIESRITSIINSEKQELIDKIKEFQNLADGEYTVYILELCDDAVVGFTCFSDYLGRLQTYFCMGKQEFIISRNLHQIVSAIENKSINENFIIDNLVFQHSLNYETIFNEIAYNKEGQILVLKINTNSSQIEYEEDHITIDVTKKNVFKTRENFVDFAYTKTKQAVECRVNYLKGESFSCDVTGGFDSRSVFGFLTDKKNVMFTTNNILGNEELFVNNLIESYGLKEKLAVIPHSDYPNTNEVKALLRYIVPFAGNYYSNSVCWHALEKQNEKVATRFRFGGIGYTDFIRKGIRKNNEPLHKLLIKDNLYGMSIDEAIKITGYNRKKYIDYLKSVIAAWPEKKSSDIYNKLFFLRTLVLQSKLTEDRERLHYWTIHPLWNHEICIRTMQQLPDHWRGNYLHFLLLNKIDPKLTNSPVNKSYIDFSKPSSIKRLDFKENSIMYIKLKKVLLFYKKQTKKTSHQNRVATPFLFDESAKEKLPIELEYIRDSYFQLIDASF